MATLTILKQEWVNKDQFPEELDFKNKIDRLQFKKHTDVADYLDSHPELKNKVMILRHPNQVMGKKVIFDGVNTFVEGWGYV